LPKKGAAKTAVKSAGRTVLKEGMKEVDKQYHVKDKVLAEGTKIIGDRIPPKYAGNYVLDKYSPQQKTNSSE